MLCLYLVYYVSLAIFYMLFSPKRRYKEAVSERESSLLSATYLKTRAVFFSALLPPPKNKFTGLQS